MSGEDCDEDLDDPKEFDPEYLSGDKLIPNSALFVILFPVWMIGVVMVVYWVASGLGWTGGVK